HRGNPRYVKLLAPVEPVDAVLLLEDVRQLGVAVTEHQRIIQQHIGQSTEPGLELLLVTHPLSVAPGLPSIIAGDLGDVGVPPDAAVLADEVRLSLVLDRPTGPATGRAARGTGVLVGPSLGEPT